MGEDQEVLQIVGKNEGGLDVSIWKMFDFIMKEEQSCKVNLFFLLDWQ